MPTPTATRSSANMRVKQLFLVLNVLVHLLSVDMCKSKVYKAKTVNEDEDNSVNFVNLHLGTAKWMGFALMAVLSILIAYYLCHTFRQRNRERRRDGLPTHWLPRQLGSMRARRASAPPRHHSPQHQQALPPPTHAQVYGMQEQYRPRQQAE